MKRITSSLALVLVLILSSCSSTPSSPGSPSGLYSEGHLELQKWGRSSTCCAAQGKKIAISSGGEASSKAGMEVHEKGGNIVDAAVATAFALAVERPKSCGIGGGGFMTLHLSGSKGAGSYFVDFRETAPSKASRNMFLDKEGKPIPNLSTVGGLAVATPGFVAGLYDIHKKWGKLPWKDVIQPSIKLAREGALVTLALAVSIEETKDLLLKDPTFKTVLFKADGTPLKVGDKMIQDDLAKTLEKVAKNGKKAFYEGTIAQKIAATAQKAGGILTAQDIAGYRTKFKDPVSVLYKDLVFISAPPPSAGGTLVAQMLGVLSGFNLRELAATPTDYIHVLAESMKRGFADRSVHIGDPDFFKGKYFELFTPEYTEALRKQINTSRATPSEEIRPKGEAPKGHGTTQLSLIDSEGNAISSTISINNSFGAKLAVAGTGIWLNNTMDDFSLKPGEKNVYGLTGSDANAIAPKKRPVSSMTPTIVVEEVSQKPVLALGGGGGSKIISAVFQVALNDLVLYQGDLRKSLFAPRMHHQWVPDVLELETGGFSSRLEKSLASEKGHTVKAPEWQAEVDAVSFSPATGDVMAAYDPRAPGGAEAR